MSRFIESICYENKQYHLLELHQQRIDRTFKKHFPLTIPFDLASRLPKLNFEEKYKVRVLYSNEALDVEFAKYVPARIKTLKPVETSKMSYEYKHEERGAIDKLFAQRSDADDVIIVKNGWVTDSSYANLVFWDGNKWYTPHTYLLNGVKRQLYLKYGLIGEKSISLMNIRDFEKVSLINAMLDIGDVEVAVKDILCQ